MDKQFIFWGSQPMEQFSLIARILTMAAVPVGGIVWLGMGSGAQYYDVPPTQARASISSAYLPTHVLGSYVKGSRVSRPDNETVVTSLIGEGGVELMRFVTKVEPSGTGSSVSTTVEPPVGKNAERAKKVMNSQPFVMSLMNKVAQEHVDAAIEKRPFNMMAMNPAGEAAANAIPGMKEQIADANASAAAISRMQQEERRYSSSSQAGGWGANTPKSKSTMSTGTPSKSGGWGAGASNPKSDWGTNTPDSETWKY